MDDSQRKKFFQKLQELEFRKIELIQEMTTMEAKKNTESYKYKNICQELQKIIDNMDSIQCILNNIILPPQLEKPNFDYSILYK